MSGTHRDLYAGPKVAVLHAKTTDEGWDQYRLVLKSLFCMKRTTEESSNPYRLAILVLKSLICMQETTGEGWNPYSLFILVLRTLLWVLKTTDEVWDQYRLVSLVLKSLFCMKKKRRWGLELIYTCHSGANHTVLHAQNDRLGLGLIETCYSGTKVAVCIQKPRMRAGTHRD